MNVCWRGWVLVAGFGWASLAVHADDPLPKGEPAELKTDTGTLYGTLDLPAGGGPFPVVLIHAGSGPTDRDGNSAIGLKNDSLKLLGRALAADGIAALRIDKRGIAASAKAFPAEEEEDVRFGMYVADAAAWADWLRKDKRFSHVGIVGHSEGALVGTLAAKKTRLDALVSLCGPGRPIGVVLREQLRKNLSKGDAAKCEAILDELEAGRTVADVPKEPAILTALFRPGVQPYLISQLTLDPVKELAGVACPVLVVSGTTDIQVAEADFKVLAAARKGIQAVRIEHMNHVLKRTESTNQLLQLPLYADPKPPLHPKLAAAVVGFLKAAARGK